MAQAVAGAICISASAVLFTLANVGPVPAAFYRCALPLPALAALAIAERRREGARSIASHGWAALAGFFLALNLVFWMHTIADVGAGAATVLGNLQVLFIAGLGWAIMREKPARLLVIMLPVMLGGVVLVSGMIGSHGTARHPAAGALCGLATSAAFACFLLILRQTAGQARHPTGQLFDATTGAAIGVLLIGLISGGLHLAIPWHALGWLLVLTLTSGIVGWLLITRSLPHLPATVSALILLLEPVGAIILGAAVLSQRPSLLQIAGAVLVCGGVLIVATGQAKTEKVTEESAAWSTLDGAGQPR
ncbi:MAG TPA: DMT family transporter [Streptosporangiaceae bacterium]|nr:DMT family transporter [Streptosporangiaceae bacterium]